MRATVAKRLRREARRVSGGKGAKRLYRRMKRDYKRGHRG